MFEAQIEHASLFKKILDSIKDLVDNANFDCSPTGITVQAMDSSHVSLVAMLLKKDGFLHYRCDRNISLGINLASLTKVLKCAGNEDKMTIRAQDNPDTVTFIFESPDDDRVAEFDLKLMNIDSEVLGIPDQEYDAILKISSSHFQKICRDLASIGDTVVIEASKSSVTFQVSGDMGTSKLQLKRGNKVDSEDAMSIDLKEPVSLIFALRYLNFFTKATALCNTVQLSLSKDVPVVVEYRVEDMGYIRYYLAPKVDEESS